MSPRSGNVSRPLEGWFASVLFPHPCFSFSLFGQVGFSSPVHMTDRSTLICSLTCPFVRTRRLFKSSDNHFTVSSAFILSQRSLSSPSLVPYPPLPIGQVEIRYEAKYFPHFLIAVPQNIPSLAFIEINPFSCCDDQISPPLSLRATWNIAAAEYHIYGERERKTTKAFCKKLHFWCFWRVSCLFHSGPPRCCIISNHSCSQDGGEQVELQVDNRQLWTHGEHKTDLPEKHVN